RGRQFDRRTELVLEAVDGDLELHRPDRSEHRRLVTERIVTQHLHDTLLIELGDARAELLEPPGVADTGDGEVLGREARNRLERHRLVDPQGVAYPDVTRVHETDHVTGIRSVDRLPLLAEHRMGVLRRELLAGCAVR